MAYNITILDSDSGEETVFETELYSLFFWDNSDDCVTCMVKGIGVTSRFGSMIASMDDTVNNLIASSKRLEKAYLERRLQWVRNDLEEEQ